MELTAEQIKRQDFVDNRIFEIIQVLNPSSTEIDWDIEMIANVREFVQHILSGKVSFIEEEFYPFIIENGN
jgi:hypothetical protein